MSFINALISQRALSCWFIIILAQLLAQNESKIHFERLVYADRIGYFLKTKIGRRMGKRFTVFAETSAEVSGRKNCKEPIFALAGQALLRKNRPRGGKAAPAD